MNPSTPHSQHRHPWLGCRWMRLFGLLLFIYGVNYPRIHLALDAHLHGPTVTLPDASPAHPAPSISGPESDAHHAPHMAADHSVRVASQAPVRLVTAEFCPLPTTIALNRSEPRPSHFLTDRQNPPGLPPPHPLQPRAPPLA